MKNDIPTHWVVLWIADNHSTLDLRYCDILSPDPYDTYEYAEAKALGESWGYDVSLVDYAEFSDLFLAIGDNRRTYMQVHSRIWCRLRDMKQAIIGHARRFSNASLKRYVVKMRDNDFYEVMAEDRKHAAEQARNAYPNDAIRWVSLTPKEAEGAD